MSVDRGFTWMDDETLALINIFGKDDIQHELNGSKRNFAVYERIARELANAGFSRTAYQCREKIKRLRKEYQLAKFYLQNSISPKKPMKHFESLDRVFNKEAPTHTNNSELNLLHSDQEDELHFTYNQDHESDASNSCTGIDPNILQSILPGPSTLSDLEDENLKLQNAKPDCSPLNTHIDSDDTLLINGEQDFDSLDKVSHVDDSEPPWVPNVVLVENGEETEELSLNSKKIENNSNENDSLKYFQDSDQQESFFQDSEEPPQKKRKQNSKSLWFKKLLDQITDNFVKYQESSEIRFLERITHLEQERMKRDENMQRLWIEFEERRRKEEQEHELKMMSLFGQFIHQIGANENNTSK